jgi:hypothetical protein
MLPSEHCNFSFRECESILRFRIVQEAVDKLTILLVTSEPMPASAVNELKSALQRNLGEPMRIEIQFVDNIPKDGLKFRSFVSRIQRKQRETKEGNKGETKGTEPLWAQPKSK